MSASFHKQIVRTFMSNRGHSCSTLLAARSSPNSIPFLPITQPIPHTLLSPTEFNSCWLQNLSLFFPFSSAPQAHTCPFLAVSGSVNGTKSTRCGDSKEVGHQGSAQPARPEWSLCHQGRVQHLAVRRSFSKEPFENSQRSYGPHCPHPPCPEVRQTTHTQNGC